MSERNQQAEERTEDLCIHIQGPISFDVEGYIEVPTDGEWHNVVLTGNANEIDEIFIDGDIEASIPEYHITWRYVTSSTSSEALTEEGFYSPYADRVLSAEEYAALRELLDNHPEIKSWWLKNNILYLEVEDDDEEDSN